MSQVGQERGLRIEMGTYPLNLFMQTSLTEQANKEPAREVLVRVFDEINAPLLAGGLPSVRLTWRLRNNSNDEFYLLNIYPMPPPSRCGLGTPAGIHESQPQDND